MRYSKPLLYLLHLSSLATLSYADITYTDADFSSPITSPIQSNATTGNVTINTTSASTPQINNPSGFGLDATDGKTLTLNNTGDFTIDANYGIRVVNTSNPSIITNTVLSGSGTVNVNGRTRGIFVGRAGKLTSDSKVNVTASGVGIMAYESGEMIFNKEVTVTTTANNAIGIAVQKGDPSATDPTITFNDNVIVDIQGTGGTAVNAQVIPNYGARGGKIIFNEGIEAQTTSGNVIESTGGTEITINSGSGVNQLTSKDYNKMAAIAEDGLININGKSIIKGHIAGTQNGIVNLDLTKDSTLMGATVTAGGGQVNLAMTEGTWTMTESSDLTNLTLNNSHVIFNDTNFSQLTTNTLSGSGIFTLKTDLVAGQGDKLIVTNTSAGNHTLIINNQGSSSSTGKETLTVVQTGDGIADFSLKHTVEVGGYEYDLHKASNNKDWELYGMGKKTSTAQAGISFLNSGYLLNYIGTQTLFQRMGELKSTNGQEGNFWIRGFAGKLNSFNSNKLHGFGMDYNGYQLGVDKLLPTANGNLYIGGMLGYTHANPDYKRGTGAVKDYNIGIYGTYIDNSGFYIDTVAKYMYLRNRFDVSDTAGTKVNGTAKNRGYSLSAETGKRFNINKSPLYLEPQAQITYSYMGSSTTHASNGLKVELNSYNSLLARTGVAVGYQINNSQNPIDVYLKTSYVKEFAGKTSYKLNHNKEKHNFRGGWVDSAIGINSQFNKRHNIYGEVSYANGDRFNKQQINLGYRYQF